MEFILVLASVFLLSHSQWLAKLHQDEWLEVGKELGYGSAMPKALADVLLVAVPLLVVYTIYNELDRHWFGLLSLLLAALVFFYSLGRSKHESQIDHFQRCLESNDQQGAFESIKQFLPESNVDSYPQLQALFEKGLLHFRFDRWFAVVFWFFLTGPVGALGYRILAMLEESSGDENLYRYNSVDIDEHASSASNGSDEQVSDGKDAQQGVIESPTLSIARLLYFLEWIPTRLLGLSFGLVGQFSGFSTHLSSALDANQSSADCLHNCALLALDYDEPSEQTDSANALLRIKAVERLVRHSMIFWVAVIAFVQLIV